MEITSQKPNILISLSVIFKINVPRLVTTSFKNSFSSPILTQAWSLRTRVGITKVHQWHRLCLPWTGKKFPYSHHHIKEVESAHTWHNLDFLQSFSTSRLCGRFRLVKVCWPSYNLTVEHYEPSSTICISANLKLQMFCIGFFIEVCWKSLQPILCLLPSLI